MNGMTRRELQLTDRADILHILNTAQILHLGLCDDGEPYVVPMNYGYEMTDDGRLFLYVHGAVQGKKLDIMRKNPRIFVEMECDIAPFTGDVACRYGMSYRSLMGRGTAVFVDDPQEKMHALSVLMKTQTGEDFTFTEPLACIVAIVRLEIDEYTAKHRPTPKTRPCSSDSTH